LRSWCTCAGCSCCRVVDIGPFGDNLCTTESGQAHFAALTSDTPGTRVVRWRDRSATRCANSGKALQLADLIIALNLRVPRSLSALWKSVLSTNLVTSVARLWGYKRLVRPCPLSADESESICCEMASGDHAQHCTNTTDQCYNSIVAGRKFGSNPMPPSVRSLSSVAASLSCRKARSKTHTRNFFSAEAFSRFGLVQSAVKPAVFIYWRRVKASSCAGHMGSAQGESSARASDSPRLCRSDASAHFQIARPIALAACPLKADPIEGVECESEQQLANSGPRQSQERQQQPTFPRRNLPVAATA
jgi:hypothetical protein